jgi:hypothetical protein
MARRRLRPIVWSSDPTSRDPGGTEMTRYERKLYFERLVALRDAYRVETRESTGMTVEQAMTFAEQAFNDAVEADVASIATASANGSPAAE